MKKSIFIIIPLVIISFVMIGFGVYFIKLSSYKNIIDKTVDVIFDDAQKSFIAKHEYMNFDKLTYSSDIKVTTNSLKENISDIEGERIKKLLTIAYNMNGSNNRIYYERDLSNKKYLFKFDSEVKDKKYEGKVLVNNSTEYYYLKDYTKKYVNNGSNNYFESITSEDRDNISYLMGTVKEAIKKQLSNSDDIVKTKATQEINGVNTECDKLSISLDKNRLIVALNKIHDDLEKDKRSNYIISNYYKDFSSLKYTKKNLKVSNFVLNIYTYGVKATPAKLEIKFNYKEDNYIFVYQYGEDINIGSFVKNNTVVYNFTDKITENGRIISLTDKNMTDSGKITLSNKTDDYSIDLDVKKDDKNIRFNYSSKVKPIKKEVTYENDRRIYFYILDNKEFSFEVNIKSDITATSNIDEDISEAMMKSSLSEEEKEKINNYKDDMLDYLES